MQADITLSRPSRIYRPGEDILGCVVLECPKVEERHNGIGLCLDAIVALHPRGAGTGAGLFAGKNGSVIPIYKVSQQVAKPGTVPIGTTELPFEITLPKQNDARRPLYETYHGLYIIIQYTIRVEVRRSLLNRDLQKTIEFLLEYAETDEQRHQEGTGSTIQSGPVKIMVTSNQIESPRGNARMPNFVISGFLDAAVCKLTLPLTGEIIIEKCDRPIKSVELQLMRMETIGDGTSNMKEATEIQNLQIGDGDVFRNTPIPIYMVFPRLFTCPTLITPNFRIEYELNVIVIFCDDHLVMENFKLFLSRF